MTTRCSPRPAASDRHPAQRLGQPRGSPAHRRSAGRERHGVLRRQPTPPGQLEPGNCGLREAAEPLSSRPFQETPMDPRSEVLLRQAELFGGRYCSPACRPTTCWDSWRAPPPGAGTPANSSSWTSASAGAAPSALPRRRGVRHGGAVLAEVPRADGLSVADPGGTFARPTAIPGGREARRHRARRQAAGQLRPCAQARQCPPLPALAGRVEQAPAAPDLDALASHFTLQLADGPLEVVSLPGVFSHGRLDLGSALLLEHLDNPPGGRLLDFGCGAGIPVPR